MSPAPAAAARRAPRTLGPILCGALALCAALPAPAAAQLAGLRSHSVVEEASVRLSDLFEDAGPNAQRAIGPAPAPGRRVVVEAAQLQAIARAHGVAWRPLTGTDRVVLERPGRALSREEILEPLRAELLRLGLDPEAELELPGFAPPMVPPAVPVEVAIEQPALDNNRFGATLVVGAEGMPVLRLRLSGRANATVAVAVAARRLPLGAVAGPADVQMVRLRVDRARPGLAIDASQVVGQQLRRPATPGAPFALADLHVPVLVEKNALVTLLLDAGGLALTAQGRAMESAGRGALVPVMNTSSRQVVEGRVIGPGRVRVGPSAPPPPGR